MDLGFWDFFFRFTLNIWLELDVQKRPQPSHQYLKIHTFSLNLQTFSPCCGINSNPSHSAGLLAKDDGSFYPKHLESRRLEKVSLKYQLAVNPGCLTILSQYYHCLATALKYKQIKYLTVSVHMWEEDVDSYGCNYLFVFKITNQENYYFLLSS